MNNTMFDSVLIENELDTSGFFASTTKGISMRPLFRTGRDVVIIEKPKGELKKYDVALYRYPDGKYVLHRVIRVLDDRYVIRGDNTFVKEYIPKERVIGVLTRFNRKGRSYTVADRGYRVYSVLWCFIYPVRFALHKCRLFCGRVLRKLGVRRRKEVNK